MQRWADNGKWVIRKSYTHINRSVDDTDAHTRYASSETVVFVWRITDERELD
jgi:hypothetical protein